MAETFKPGTIIPKNVLAAVAEAVAPVPQHSGHGRAAVKDGRLVYTSVSQIKKFDETQDGGCNRRWWFRYVARLPEPQSPAAVGGERVHAIVEHYLKIGQWPDPPEELDGDSLAAWWISLRIAQAGHRFLPQPGAGLLIEQQLDGFLDAAGVPLIGRVDLVIQRAGQDLEIVDHKTTSNIKRYAKTPADLEWDAQMLGYGEWARRKFGNSETVRLSHIYYQTKAPYCGAKPTTLVQLNTVKARWQSEVEPIVERMKVTAGEKSHETVSKNEASCWAFGKPCPYFAQCSDRNPLARLSMSLLKSLGATSPAPTAPAEPPRTLTIEDKTTAGQAEAAGVRVPEGHVMVGADKALDAKLFGLGLKPAGQGMKGLGDLWTPPQVERAKYAQILPPDAPASNPEIAAECEQCAIAGKSGQQHLLADCPTLAKAAAPLEAPRRRGRPKKTDTNAPGANVAQTSPAGPTGPSEITGAPASVQPAPAGVSGTATATAAVASADAPSSGTVPGTTPRPPEAAQGGFDLYIDAIPSGPYQTLERYVAHLHEEIIIKGAGQPDAALVEYGKGKGLMRAAAAAEPPTGVCVIFTSDLSAPVIEALAPKARFVVRGVR